MGEVCLKFVVVVATVTLAEDVVALGEPEVWVQELVLCSFCLLMEMLRSFPSDPGHCSAAALELSCSVPFPEPLPPARQGLTDKSQAVVDCHHPVPAGGHTMSSLIPEGGS